MFCLSEGLRIRVHLDEKSDPTLPKTFTFLASSIVGRSAVGWSCPYSATDPCRELRFSCIYKSVFFALKNLNSRYFLICLKKDLQIITLYNIILISSTTTSLTVPANAREMRSSQQPVRLPVLCGVRGVMLPGVVGELPGVGGHLQAEAGRVGQW